MTAVAQTCERNRVVISKSMPTAEVQSSKFRHKPTKLQICMYERVAYTHMLSAMLSHCSDVEGAV